MDNKARVLVVDDEVYLREIIALDLERAGYAVLQAANGNEAFAMVKSARIDLVVSDVRMPHGNGLQLLDWIRAYDPGHPSFIFITAYADISSIEALNLGAEAFLRKPVEKDELLELVAHALVPRETRWGNGEEDYEGAQVIECPKSMPLAESLEVENYIELGQGGMFLEMGRDHPACYEIVRFDLSCSQLQSGRIAGFGRVRWTRHEASDEMLPGIGIEFLSLTEASRHSLVEYQHAQKPKAYVPIGLRRSAKA